MVLKFWGGLRYPLRICGKLWTKYRFLSHQHQEQNSYRYEILDMASGTLQTQPKAQLIILDRLLLLKMDLGFKKETNNKQNSRWERPTSFKDGLCTVCIINHFLKLLY